MRVIRTFAFVDLSPFTQFTEESGDAAAAEVLARFRSLVRSVASRRGVLVGKWLGDGVMLVGEGEPTAATVLELHWRSLRACAPLVLRSGLAQGPVMLFEGDDYIGSAVNLAARLCERANPLEMLADAEVARAAPRWARGIAAPDADIRGFTDPVEVWRLVRTAPDIAHMTDPVCTLPLSPEYVADTRPVGEETVGFCSSSCAAAWDSGLAAALREPAVA